MYMKQASGAGELIFFLKAYTNANVAQQSMETLNAFEAVVTDELKAGGSVALVGFGAFSVKTREARNGRNPKTGEALQIAASNAVTFKAGKALKDAVN